jgi:enoyl-CoA hydratase
VLRIDDFHDGSVRLLTIDRPQRRNAVDLDTVNAIAIATQDAVHDGARVMVLTGADGHFSAGADLGGVEDHGFAASLRSMLIGLRDSPLITVAAVAGSCFGAGLQMAGSCDVRVMASDVRIGIPAAQRGIAVDQWTVALLVELVGAAAARALLIACEVLDRTTAERVGLVTRHGSLEDALAWSAELAKLAPLSVVAHKAALTHVAEQIRGAENAQVAAAIADAWASADAAEGRAAFAGKRLAVFVGQ